jgi:transposase
MPRARLLAETADQRIEVITGPARRRRWSTEQKLRIIEESDEPGTLVSEIARRQGVAANLLFRWRKLLADGGAAAVGSDEEVVGASAVRKLEARIRELERQLGRKTLEVEILTEALDSMRAKKPTLLSASPKRGDGR